MKVAEKMSKHTWEGAELSFYIDGESYAFSLSDTEFAAVAKLLGFQMDLKTGEITAYSDETIKQFMTMNKNPFRLN